MQVAETATHYDVVIVGGGMVGASFACALDHSLNGKEGKKISILVVEAFQLPDQESSQITSKPPANEVTFQSGVQANFQPSFDARTTALSYGSSQILDSFDLWQYCRDVVTEIKDIHVSDRGHLGVVKLSSQQQQLEALGFVIENRALGRVLNKTMQASTGIELLCPANVLSIEPQPDGMKLALNIANNKHEVQANLVVLADGGKSPVCSQLGITNTEERYQQRAMISNIAFSKPHNNVAYERFTDTGPLAVLPLASQHGLNRGALIWTLEENEAATLMEQNETELIALLQQSFGYRLGRITRIGERSCYPLALTVTKEQIRPGLVLLGNVAHTLHPIAGQGLNLALRDIESLVQVLSEAHGNNNNLGSLPVLQKYLDQQSKDQFKTISFTHYMNRLFSSNHAALVWARKFGLFSIDMIPALKQNFARQAMGLADR